MPLGNIFRNAKNEKAKQNTLERKKGVIFYLNTFACLDFI